MSDKMVQNIEEAKVTLQLANCYGLEAEVVTWALIEMKCNPKLEISEALKLSVQEWLK